jgi:hypothetical protein
MATIAIDGDELIITMHGWDKLLTLRSKLEVPLDNIRSVTVRPAEGRYDETPGIKVAGGYLPGKLATGYFWIDERGWAFYDVHDPEKTIGLDVSGQRTKLIVVQIDDETPEDAAEKIRRALAARAR